MARCIDRLFTDGEALVSASWDNALHLWNPDTGKLLRRLKAHTDPVVSATYSPNGETLVSGSHDGTIRLWDTQTWEGKIPSLDIQRTSRQSHFHRTVRQSRVGIRSRRSIYGMPRLVNRKIHSLDTVGRLPLSLLALMAARLRAAAGTIPSACGTQRQGSTSKH